MIYNFLDLFNSLNLIFNKNSLVNFHQLMFSKYFINLIKTLLDILIQFFIKIS
jgi:hypothetical protein